MKKLILLMISVGMLTACTQINPTDEVMIEPSQFSEETEEVLELFDDEIQFFDYTVDETIKSCTLSIWFFEDGAWVNSANSYGSIENPKNRVAFRYRDTGYDLYTMDESGHTRSSSSYVYSGFSDSTHQLSTYLTNPRKIGVNQEIPLWVKIGNLDGSLSIEEDFRDSDCTAGVVLTVTFSDQVQD